MPLSVDIFHFPLLGLLEAKRAEGALGKTKKEGDGGVGGVGGEGAQTPPAGSGFCGLF